MNAAKFLLTILLIGIIVAAGCVGTNSKPATTATTNNAPAQTAPTGNSVGIDTSSIDAGITDANAEQAELTGDINESALDLGI